MDRLPDNACLHLPLLGEACRCRLTWLPLGRPRLKRAFHRLLCLPPFLPYLLPGCFLEGVIRRAGQDLLLLAEAWGLPGITALTLPALQGDLMERNLSEQLHQAIWCGFFSSTL